MKRFLLCSFALVLLYPAGIDMYLVGLPRIAADLNASEAQLHIAFSVYLAGMATAMLFAGKIADQSGRKPVAIVGALVFMMASLLCSRASEGSLFLSGRFLQGVGAGGCYVVAFAILRDTLDEHRRAKVLSLLNGITCIVPVLAPVVGHLIMLRFPWQSLFYTMSAMGIIVGLLSLFILRETRPARLAPRDLSRSSPAAESLVNRFFVSRLAITTLSVSVILTFVNASPVLLMEVMGFSRGDYAITMALTAGVSMVVSFSTPFALGLFKPRTLMLVSQGLFLTAGVTLSLAHTNTVTLFGLTLICAGFSVGFGVAMSQALGPFSLRAGVASSTLGLAPTPLMVSMEQSLADWMQMGNQLLDKPHHQTPRGLKFELAAESPLMMIMFNSLSQQIYQRYPQATIKVRNWDYDSLEAITRGEVDIGFTGRESHPRSRELLSLLPLAIDFEVLFSDLPWVWLREDHPALREAWDLDTFLRYPHISICWEQSDTWALDDVLQEMGRKRHIALSLPGFEQSLFMAAQPDHTLIATAPRYCQHYNQLHQLPLVARPLPFDAQQREKLMVPFTLLWHKRNSHNPKIVWLRQAINTLCRRLI